MRGKARLNASTPFKLLRRLSVSRRLPPRRLLLAHPSLGNVGALHAHPIRCGAHAFPLAATSTASPSPQKTGANGGRPAANSTGSATAKRPTQKQKADSSSDSSSSEDEPEVPKVPKKKASKASDTIFSPMFGGGQSAPPSATPLADSAKQELLLDTLANLTKLGYTGLSEVDLGKLNPPDIYEEELQVMAEVRAYFQVAYKVRPLPMVPIRRCQS